MNQFWLHGYFDTSIDDLVKATGVSRYGIYGTFGGKRELFLKALDNYRDVLVAYQLKQLEAKDADWHVIEEYFSRLVEIAKTPEGTAGCFMCNTSTELAPHDVDVDVKVKDHIKRLQKVFRNALSNEMKSDSYKKPDIDKFANVLVGVTQGIFTLSRSPKNLSIIENLIEGVVKKPI